MRPSRIQFGGERNAKNNEILKFSSIKQQQPIVDYLFGRASREKKGGEKGTAWSRSRYEYPGTWYVSHEGHLRQPTTNKLEAGPAANGRDNERQMHRSHASSVFVKTRDVRGTCPTQKLPLFFNLINIGPRKNNIVFRRPQDWGGILKSRNRPKTMHFSLVRTTYIIRAYMQKSNPTC